LRRTDTGQAGTTEEEDASSVEATESTAQQYLALCATGGAT